MKLLWQHLQNNRGAIMISKMLMIVISVCVSSIVLVMSTAAMQDGVGTWFNKQIEEWFDPANGAYSVAQTEPERNANGTYKNTLYYRYDAAKKQYLVLREVETYTNGIGVGRFEMMVYDENWEYQGYNKETVFGNGVNSGVVATISEDGKRVVFSPPGLQDRGFIFQAKGME